MTKIKILEIHKDGWQKRVCTGGGNSNKGCGSVLLLDIKDVKVIHHYLLEDTADTFYSFVCPVCGAMTDIPPSELPISITDKIENKSYVKVKSIFRGRR